MDLSLLRAATAGEHAATEDTVPLMSPSLTRAEYVDALRRFHRVVSAWDRWSDAHAPEDLLPLLRGRRRASLLRDDLNALGAQVPEEASQPEDPRMENSEAGGQVRSIFLGRLYVMEGSTLGGQYIARHVEQHLSLTPGVGDSFFTGYGDSTGERWREVRAVLQDVPDDQAESVIAAAKEMFSIFGAAMQG